jgi:hypothetical protein
MSPNGRDGLRWRRSSHSGDAGECVETAVLPDLRIAVRDSKHPEGAKAGEFDPR